MTDEERRRTMEFILEQQAQVAASLQRIEEDRIRDRPRLALVEQSFRRVVELIENYDARMDGVESRASALERKTSSVEEAVQHLDRLMKKAQARLDRLESGG